MTERHTGRSLLPPNATHLEQQLSLLAADFRDDIPWEDLKAVFDPARCPARLLPWLATVFSVDVWRERWSEAQKRDVIARSIEMHRLKGTLAGLEAYLELIGARVAQAITPPALFFASDFGPEAYQDWLGRLPEVRIYHWQRDTSHDISGALSEEPEDLPEDVDILGAPLEHYLAFTEDFEDDGTPGCFSLHDDAFPIEAGVKAVLYDNGVETELEIESGNVADARMAGVSDVERVYFPEKVGSGFYASDLDSETEDTTFADDGYLHDGSDKQYAIYVRRSGQNVKEIGAPSIRGRAAADSDPVRVFVNGDASGGWFLDDPTEEAFASIESDILASYYDSWRVVDPKVKATHGPATSFLDYDRFGIPAYTAEIQVDATEPAIDGAWFLDNGPPGFLMTSNFDALWDVCDVVVIASAKRDAVGLDLDYADRPSIRRLYSLEDMILR